MAFGTLHKIQCEIERQADAVRQVRSLLHQAKWELENSDDKENAKRLVSEAFDVLTNLAN